MHDYPCNLNWQHFQTNTWLSSEQQHTIRTPHKMLVSLTVGKVDAGMAVLLTEDKRIVSAPNNLNVCWRIAFALDN
jgi:hypothetical protein